MSKESLNAVSEYETPATKKNDAEEAALDTANELSFPASDPVAASNITRIEKAPETAPASEDHQNKNAVDEAVKQHQEK